MKGATIYPLSEVSRQSVERYLISRGSRPEMVSWKYFDQPFNRNRERGLVWVQHDQVRGFIGLIPFEFQDRTVLRNAAWTCDWSVEDPGRNPGIGIVLLRAAIASAKYTLSLGGNEVTRALLPRIALQTIDDAAVVYVRPLRLGHVLEKVDRRAAAFTPAAPRLASTVLGSVSLPRRGIARARRVPVERGVSPALAPMLAEQHAAVSAPAYDFEYLHWQCGRCPDIESWTCYGAAAAGQRSGAVLFRTRIVPSRWRMVWWVESGADGFAADVLLTACAFAHERAGVSLSVVVSRSDEHRAALLRAHGFTKERGGHPLYVTAADRHAFSPVQDVRGLSYLDTDLAHLA